MITPLEALYNYATEEGDLTHWLRENEMVGEYQDSVRVAEKNRETLLKRLEGTELELFQRYLEGQDTQNFLWEQMLFREGVALGLYLGGLPGRR